MCELLGVSSDREIELNHLLRTFYGHSAEHPNGWGLAFFDDGNISIEREPIKASDSFYLRSRLTGELKSSRMMAHIRRATIGEICYENTHPFSSKDITGRTWVLMHNGTIFEAQDLARYQCSQKGTTDSERILLYLTDKINDLYRDNKDTTEEARIRVVDELVHKLSQHNKLNLLIFDGDNFYVHKNEEGTLHRYDHNGIAILSTHPLTREGWEEVPKNRLFVYKDGRQIYAGKTHDNTYIHNKENMKALYLGYSGL